jgi:parallel beta-helix repeat protein
MARMVGTCVGLVVALCLLWSGSVASAGASDGSGCTAIAAPDGSDDSGNGSAERPYATPARLLASLASGETGCLRGGEYSFSELTFKRPGVTLTAYGSERVTLRGTIKVVPTGAGSVIAGMVLNGAGGASDIGPRIYADRVVLRDNEITNDHTQSCVTVSRYFDAPHPTGVVIENNVIHDCGRLPATNHDHGVYLSEARETIVRNNLIYDNADRGIQMYPDVEGSQITANVIVANGQGLNFSGTGELTSNDNLVEGNVIADSTLGWNVYSGLEGPTATGNVLRDNCVHASNPDDALNADAGIETPSRNFAAEDNSVVDSIAEITEQDSCAAASG